jgi:hypothetical protein
MTCKKSDAQIIIARSATNNETKARGYAKLAIAKEN